MNNYTVALYSRLSSEDALKGNDPSNSIVNQKILLDEFVRNHSELAGSKTIHISDMYNQRLIQCPSHGSVKK